MDEPPQDALDRMRRAARALAEAKREFDEAMTVCVHDRALKTREIARASGMSGRTVLLHAQRCGVPRRVVGRPPSAPG